MKGFRSTCSICGIQGRKYGCPSWFDQCTDTEACRDRALRNKQREIDNLKKQLKESNEN